MSALVLTVIISLIAWFWSNNLRARERALDLTRHACKSANVQFLDETVAISRIGFGRESSGHLNLQRVYSFDFTLAGDIRREGRIAMQGMKVKAIHLDHPDGPIVIEPGTLR